MSDDITACAALVETGDPDRFLAAMAASPALRRHLFVLYALNLEVAKAPFVTQEPMIAEMRLQFWRDVVSDAVAGKPTRAHEVAGPLADLIRAHDLPAGTLDRMIAARRFDIYPNDPGQSGLDRDTYLRRTGGDLMVLTALACGMDAGLTDQARAVGTAMGTAAWLRAVPDLIRHKKVTEAELDSDALQDRARQAWVLLQGVRSTAFGLATPALRAAWQTRWVLERAIDDPRRIIEADLTPSEFRRRGGLLWRSLRGVW